MLGKLILLFTVVPLAELYILLKVAEATSALTTFLIVIITGVVGAYLAKSEGKAIISKIKYELSCGHMPAENLIDGLCVLVGGAFLITPGIITDIAGFSLVIPFTRVLYKNFIRIKFNKMLDKGNINFWRY
ncbi:FxsA family protein [Abyssisolibacter fermentans]|uniref:FxsA family protein n=1 Tax=Abyssisolibacter fermentans TaxID=1766203 RepID=UPI00082EF932|nr:FxsA family protein [Abyssisolibacter fermentans]